jgi:hypothetical protein
MSKGLLNELHLFLLFTFFGSILYVQAATLLPSTPFSLFVHCLHQSTLVSYELYNKLFFFEIKMRV